MLRVARRDAAKLRRLTELYKEFLKELVPGELFQDPMLDLEGTPERVSRMFMEELCAFYAPSVKEDMERRFKTFPCPYNAGGMVTMGPIAFQSLCSHHQLPFAGEAWVGYLPAHKLVGLSKIPRVVRHFSQQLQVQERLTDSIADYLEEKLQPQGIGVYMQARHFCCEQRGARCIGAVTKTQALRGLFLRKPSIRQEFMALVGK